MIEVNTKYFSLFKNLLLFFFLFAAVYPTIRILLIGGGDAASFPEFIFSGLNEIILFLALLVGYLFINNIDDWKNKILLFDKVVLIYILFNTLLGTILAQDLKLSVYGFRMTYEPMLCYFMARYLFFISTEEQERIFHFLFCLLTIISSIGLILYFFFPDFIDYMMLKGNYFQSIYFIPRMGSIFWNPIIFASIASICAIYFYHKLLFKFKIVHLVFFIIHFSCLTLTVSRGALIAFLLSYIFISYYSRNYKSILPVSGIMIATFLFLLFLMTDSFRIMKWMASSTQSTLTLNEGLSRVELWRRSWLDFINQPLGYGLGKAGHVAHRFLLHSSIPASRWSTDGWYLKLANETGFIGLISFCLLVYIYLKNFVINITNKSVLFFSIALFLLLQNSVSNVLDFYYFSFLFWFVIGYSINTMQRKVS